MEKIASIKDLEVIKQEYNDKLNKYRYQVLLCGGAGCISSNSIDVKNAVIDEIMQNNLTQDVKFIETGCMGTCAVGPVMLILPERIYYTELTPEIARSIIRSHILKGEILEEHTFYDNSRHKHIPKMEDIDFFKEQVKIALRNCGAMEYDSINAYIARDGFLAAGKALTLMKPEEIIGEMKTSG
ncbi:MAG: NAD(P)H-dependent oxidoreductase subunit E, partial [Mobilitalea sp.]